MSARNKDTKQISVFEGLGMAQREGGRTPAHPTLSPHSLPRPPCMNPFGDKVLIIMHGLSKANQ